MPKVRVDDCPAGPALDAAVARVLGLEVLGVVACCRDLECGHYAIPHDGHAGDHAVERPVYLRDCMCEFREDEDADYFGHISGCLAIVGSYSGGIVPALELRYEYRAFTLNYFGTADLEVSWRARFLSHDYVEEAHADTAPLAITRAFLKVNRVEYIDVD